MSAFLYLITVLIWGTTFFAIIFQVAEISVLQSVLHRFAIAALAMWVLSLAMILPGNFLILPTRKKAAADLPTTI